MEEWLNLGRPAKVKPLVTGFDVTRDAFEEVCGCAEEDHWDLVWDSLSLAGHIGKEIPIGVAEDLKRDVGLLKSRGSGTGWMLAWVDWKMQAGWQWTKLQEEMGGGRLWRRYRIKFLALILLDATLKGTKLPKCKTKTYKEIVNYNTLYVMLLRWAASHIALCHLPSHAW